MKENMNNTHFPCCTEVCLVVDVLSIFVSWIKVISWLKFKKY